MHLASVFHQQSDTICQVLQGLHIQQPGLMSVAIEQHAGSESKEDNALRRRPATRVWQKERMEFYLTTDATGTPECVSRASKPALNFKI